MPDPRRRGDTLTVPATAASHRDGRPAVPRTMPNLPVPVALPPFGVEPVRELLLRLRRPTADVEAFVREVLGRGITADQVLLDLFAPVARRLGEMWETDECSFVEVTVATGRLQQLVHVVCDSLQAARQPRPVTGRILAGCLPGEQHSLGLTMVAEYLRRDGWDLSLARPMDAADAIIQLVQEQWYDVVAFSVAVEDHVPRLRRFLQQIRRASRNRSLRAIVGGAIFTRNDHLVQQVGADGWAPDAPAAAQLAASML